MRAAAVEGLDALLLVHAEGGAQQTVVVEVLEVGDASVAVEALAHVATEVYLATVLERSDGDALQLLDGQVDVEPVVSVIDVAVVVYLIDLAKGSAGVVHQHDVVLVEVLALADAIGLEEIEGRKDPL